MSITRKLVNTDEGRKVALNTAMFKKSTTAPDKIAITQPTSDRLDIQQPLFAANMLARGTALAEQSAATSSKDTSMGVSKMYDSHFFQAFFNGVERGIYPKAHKAFYQLDVNSSSLPPLVKEADILLWGKNIIDGDAARVLAGGAAMSNPTALEVSAKYTLFLNANNTQSTKKDAYDAAQEVVSGMRTEVDSLILRIWNEVETYYDNEPIESKRRNAREWGVVYVSTRSSKITGLVTNAGTGGPLEGVNVSIVESGDVVQTGVDGTFTLSTNFTGDGTLEFSLVDFVTQTFPITLGEGASIVQDAQLNHV
jgi:hypothetical protein